MSDASTDAPPAPPAEAPAQTPAPPAEPETDWKAEMERWKTIAEQADKRAKRHEDTAKENAKAAKELEQLRQATMSEQEKAVEAARNEGRQAALAEVGSTLVDAELRAQAAGKLDEKALNVLLQGLNRRAFLNDDGTVDSKSVAEFVSGIAPPPPPQKEPGFPDLGQGARSTATALNGDPLLRSLKDKLGIA